MNHENPTTDFSKYWVKLKLPTGIIVKPQLDEKAFTEKFGSEATRAFGLWMDATIARHRDPDAPEKAKKYAKILTDLGLDPQVIKSGEVDARIMDLPEDS
jgi:hypothetical protein